MKQFFASIFLSQRFLYAMISCVILLIIGHFFPTVLWIAQAVFLLFCVAIFLDFILLYGFKGVEVSRILPEKLSNGDENAISLHINNKYPITVNLELIEEVPAQFQLRNISFNFNLAPKKQKDISYNLRPTQRGLYDFGFCNTFVSISFIGIIKRRFLGATPKEIPVYPSFLQLKKYEFLAVSNRLSEIGVKKIRKIGQQTEFDKIRDYVMGDDIRTINWNATARRQQLMVNQYQDERSQQIYCLIDKGRGMKMPFDGLTLMDYAINSSLVMTNLAMRKDDKAGLITFSRKIETSLKAGKDKFQMHRLLKALYAEKTDYKEPDYGRLYNHVRHHITQRSLLLLYTNFESVVSLERQLPYLRRIAKQHLLVVVLFQNTELTELIEQAPENTDEVYTQVIAEKHQHEKKQIINLLKAHGIHTILTKPQNLTVNSINKYLELKSRGFI
jgi:uncharacterized protein (DUF58 family)